ESVEFVHREAVGGAQAGRQGIERAEAHRLVPPPILDEQELEMALAHDPLAFDGECIAEKWLRKALAPDRLLEHACDIERAVTLVEATVGFHRAQARVRRQHLVERALERDGKAREV